jgi:hypothetical protein
MSRDWSPQTRRDTCIVTVERARRATKLSWRVPAVGHRCCSFAHHEESKTRKATDAFPTSSQPDRDPRRCHRDRCSRSRRLETANVDGLRADGAMLGPNVSTLTDRSRKGAWRCTGHDRRRARLRERAGHRHEPELIATWRVLRTVTGSCADGAQDGQVATGARIQLDLAAFVIARVGACIGDDGQSRSKPRRRRPPRGSRSTVLPPYATARPRVRRLHGRSTELPRADAAVAVLLELRAIADTAVAERAVHVVAAVTARATVRSVAVERDA